jgi:septin family protein
MLKEEREDSDTKQEVQAFRKFVEDAAEKFELESFTPDWKKSGGEDDDRKRRRTRETGESVIPIAVRHSYTKVKYQGKVPMLQRIP